MNEKTTPTAAPIPTPGIGHDDKSKTATMTPPATEPATHPAPSAPPRAEPTPKV